MRLAGIHALITHGDSELSVAIAAAFVHEGADVALAASDLELQNIGDPAPPFDVLVMNTAFEWQHNLPPQSDVTACERALRTSLEAAFQSAQALATRMNDGGSIIITGPMRYAHPAEPVRALVASSAALPNLTASLAQTLAKRRIRVNSVIPGPIEAPRILARIPPEAAAAFGSETLFERAARPRDIAPVYVFLAAATEAGYVNGATLEATGGAPPPTPSKNEA